MTWRREWFGGLITAEVFQVDIETHPDFGRWSVEINDEAFVIWTHDFPRRFPSEEEAVVACLAFLKEKGVPVEEEERKVFEYFVTEATDVEREGS